MPGRSLQWAQRRPALAMASVLLALLLCFALTSALVAGGLAVWFWRESGEHHEQAEEAKQLLAEQKKRTEKALTGEQDAANREQEATKREQQAKKREADAKRQEAAAKQLLLTRAAEKLLLAHQGQLTARDAFDPQRQAYYQVFSASLERGGRYVLDLQSTQFDAYLRSKITPEGFGPSTTWGAAI